MSITVSPNFFQCLLKLQEKNHKVYSWEAVGTALGMSRQAARTLFMGEHKENSFVKYSTIAGLLTFFHEQGLPITIGDLFTVTESADTPPELLH